MGIDTGMAPLDHQRQHPGLWMGFGDLNGIDFWRNEGTIQHVRFGRKPQVHQKANLDRIIRTGQQFLARQRVFLKVIFHDLVCKHKFNLVACGAT